MAIRVPINPQTRVPQGQLGYEKAVDVTAGTRALGAVIREYGEEYNREQKKRELFDVQKLLVEETNNLELDFDEKKQVEKLGAPAFTQRIAGQYNTRHQEMIKNLRSQGYSDDAVNEFETRLGTIRSQYVAKAIEFQDKSQYAKVGKDIGDFAVGLSQYAGSVDGGEVSALDELKVGLANSGLDEIEQAVQYEQHKQGILQGARQGFTLRHPDIILQLFDPEDSLAPAGSSAVELANLNNHEKTVSTEFGSAGFNPNVIAGFLGNFKVEGGYEGAIGDNGEAAGIAQLRGSRRANFVKMFGKDPSKASIAENAKFTVWEMQNPDEAGMTVDQRDAILAAKSPEEAAELIDKYYERSDGSARNQRIEAAKLFVKTMDKADTIVQKLESSPLINDKGKTGISIIDLSTAPERMQMLAWAKQYSSEGKATERAGLEVTHQNAVNAYLTTGDYDGPKPTVERYTKIFGPVAGPQKFAELQKAEQVGIAVQQFKTQPASAINAQVEALRPKDTASPTYTEELQAYTRAREAADNIIKAREDNPSNYLFSTFPKAAEQLQAADTPEERKRAYNMINEVYRRIGIAPEKRVLFADEQAKKLQDNYAQMSPGQKINQLQEWNTELGPLHDPFMSQMTSDGHGAGADAVMWSLLSRHPNGFSTMSQILAGQKIIEDDPARKPGADVINTNFKDTLGSSLAMLNPAASKIYNDAAAAIYVANGGRTDSKLFDPDLYEESLRLAVGGLPKNKQTGIVNMTQGNVKDWTILPQRTTQLQFTNWVERLTPGVLTRLSVEKTQPLYRTGNVVPLQDIIDEGVFVAVAPNKYIIKMASDGNPLKTKSGNNFVVQINPGEPRNVPPIRSRELSVEERALRVGLGR